MLTFVCPGVCRPAITPADLSSASGKQLSQWCRERGLPVSGGKKEAIDRLQKWESHRNRWSEALVEASNASQLSGSSSQDSDGATGGALVLFE